MRQEVQREFNPPMLIGFECNLAALDMAQYIDSMDLTGFFLNLLKGDRKGQWSIAISGNWRMNFEFSDGNAYLVFVRNRRKLTRNRKYRHFQWLPAIENETNREIAFSGSAKKTPHGWAFSDGNNFNYEDYH